MARWSTGGKSAWPRRVRPANVTIARAVAAVAAGRAVVDLAAAAVAAGRAAAVTEIETEVEIAARVATTDKKTSVAPVKKPALLFYCFRQLWPIYGPTSAIGMGW